MGKSKKGKRGHYMKKVISIISIIVMVLSSFTVDVKADEKNDSQEYNPNGSGVVWSEDEVDGWNLEWISTSFFDTLISASNDEYFIEFEYDNDGKRIYRACQVNIPFHVCCKCRRRCGNRAEHKHCQSLTVFQ